MTPAAASVPRKNETACLLEAKAWFEKAVEADPSDATNHAYLGNACVRLDDLEGAERAYAKALARDPTNARVLSNWGGAYAKRGDYARALELFEEAAKLTPEDGTLAKNRDSADIRVRRVELDRLPVHLLGAVVVLAHGLQKKAEVVVRLRVRRVELDRFPVHLFGVV